MSFSSDIPLQSNQLPISIEFPSPDDINFNDILSLTYKRIASSVNTKEGAFYLLNENATFKQYFTRNNPQINRNVYRKTFDLIQLNGGNIGAGATIAFPHGITGLFNCAITYVGCTSTNPYYFSLMNYPTIYLDSVNINFTNPTALILTQADAVCEYLKN